VDPLLALLALVGAVIVVAALLSGWVDRSGVPQVAVFLAMGALIGPIGLNLVDVSVDSPILRVVATLSLVLVLFTDAVSLDMRAVREHRLLAGLMLGPGTILTTILIAAAGWYLLDLSLPLAAILGAAIASTDPVLLRGLLRRPALHNSVRQALRLESGLNDVVLLPVVLVAMEILSRSEPLTGGEWGRLGVNMLLLSPGAGILVGIVGVSAIEAVRKRSGVRRDYESIYSLGLAFAAYTAAESAHGSGFIAAFAAGLTVSAMDAELCDCFLEYGETTAEMALLFTFVLFGTSIIWSGVSAATGATLLFTVAAFVLRPVAYFPALLPARLSARNRGLIAFFGPTGLSSLLLIMLAVFKGIDGSTYLLEVCSLVVLVSVIVHGFSPMLLVRGPQEPSAPAPAPAAKSKLTLAIREVPDDRPKANTITLDEYQQLRGSANVVLVDSRSERTFAETDPVPGSVRVHPERAVADATRLALPPTATLVVFCA
jgi:NhaP-type Na+/H+ or K+/H+ antiporter